MYSTVAHMVSGMWNDNIESKRAVTRCEECNKREELIQHKDNSLDNKDEIIKGKEQQINRLIKRITKIAKEKTLLKKKAEQLEKMLFHKQKTIAFLRRQMETGRTLSETEEKFDHCGYTAKSSDEMKNIKTYSTKLRSLVRSVNRVFKPRQN